MLPNKTQLRPMLQQKATLQSLKSILANILALASPTDLDDLVLRSNPAGLRTITAVLLTVVAGRRSHTRRGLGWTFQHRLSDCIEVSGRCCGIEDQD